MGQGDLTGEGIIPIPSVDYDGRCWWCGAPATTAEHKHKKSDLVREFGTGPYLGMGAVSWNDFTHGIQRSMQGPDSGLAKFEKNLCAPCNSERSQPFDRAYTTFTAYLAANQERFLAGQHEIDLREVFGADWRAERDHLLRYYLKHICCRLAHEGLGVPEQAVTYLDGGPQPQGFALEFTIFGEWLAITDAMVKLDGHFGFVGVGAMTAHRNRHTGEPTAASGAHFYRWLHLNWLFDPSARGFGDPFPEPRFRPATRYAASEEQAENLRQVLLACAEFECETGYTVADADNDPAVRQQLEALIRDRVAAKE